ncbi:Ig-specific serine endopeptidase MIP [Ureaplasma diversum]|uniref:Ig-specific serine endopeptidase MIP n=1 Tax=Ureaplasma diversum TaxID=42094 RepID=UPI000AE667A7|nr:DUF31 family protein [Ureaplasma diversum]
MKLRNKKIFAFLAASLSLVTVATIAVACNDELKKHDPNQKVENNNDQTKEKQQDPNDVNKLQNGTGQAEGEKRVSVEPQLGEVTTNTSESILNDTKDIKVNFDSFSQNGNASIDQVYAHRTNANNITVSLTGANADQFDAKVINVEHEVNNGMNVSSITGKLTAYVQISRKGNPNDNVVRKIELSGFKRTPYVEHADGGIDVGDGSSLTKDQRISYLKSSNTQERFNYDNPEYIKRLKRQIEDPNYGRYGENIKVTDSQINSFDELAKKHHQDSYDNARLKGFTIPSYNTNGSVEGLSALLTTQRGQGISWADTVDRNQNQIQGLARILPNATYLRAAEQTFSIKFTFKDPKYPNDPNKLRWIAGTVWILDFEKNGQGYPTKWYFGTNLHVAHELQKNDIVSVTLTRINKGAPLRKKFKWIARDSNFKAFNFTYPENLQGKQKEDSPIKNFYSAIDFLKKDPQDYLTKEQKDKYKDTKEFLDFAVIEADFSKFKNMINVAQADNESETKSSTDEQLREVIKDLTNDYANRPNEHIKFLEKSYLADYSKINYPLVGLSNSEYAKNGDQLFAVGYPRADWDFFFKKYIDPEYDDLEGKKSNFSLWINGDSRLFDQLESFNEATGKYAVDGERVERGNFLSQQIGYRTFTNRPGVMDAFIGLPAAGNSSKEVDHKLFITHDNKTLISTGLQYIPRHYAPYGGASGSSIRTKDNKIVGVYHTSNISVGTGIAAALRSEGYDYGNLYGTYKLPQYDLIYGGGADQKKDSGDASYRDALKAKYGNNFKTNLFSEGVDKIPDQYKFNSTPKVDDSKTNN